MPLPEGLVVVQEPDGLATVVQEARLEKPIEVEYVRPAPRWIISRDDQQIEVYDRQILDLVNSFLRLNLLGEIVEEWTAVGRTYRYRENKG